MTRIISPARAADPPASPPAPKPPRVMMALYTWGISHLVREIGGYLWDKGWRAGRAEGLRAGLAINTTYLPAAPADPCPAHPDVDWETCPWRGTPNHPEPPAGATHTQPGEQPGGSAE